MQNMSPWSGMSTVLRVSVLRVFYAVSSLHSDEKLEKKILCIDGGITWLLQVYRGQWLLCCILTCNGDTVECTCVLLLGL